MLKKEGVDWIQLHQDRNCYWTFGNMEASGFKKGRGIS
jgi:hypothetical protein